MYCYRCFNSKYPRHLGFASYRSLAAAVLALQFISVILISGCGQEVFDKSLGGSVNDEEKTELAVPISTPYFPTTLGSRWVYRNTDGSEWAREIAELDFVNRHDFLLFYSDNPPLEENEEAGQFVFVKAPSYFVKFERIVRPITLKELQYKIGKTIEIPYKISKTVHGIFNGMEVNTRYGFTGSRAYKIHGLERSDFNLLASPLLPGKAWKALDIRFSVVHNKAPQWFSHSLDAHLEIWAKIGANRISIMTPAGTFEDCFEIQYHPTPFQIETTDLEVSVDGGFGQAAEFPKVWKEIRKYVEAEIPKTAETEIRKAMPHFQSASLWLAPEVGPVKIQDASGISELIAFDVKKGSNE